MYSYIATIKGGLFAPTGVLTNARCIGIGAQGSERKVSQTFNKKSMIWTREAMKALMGVAPPQPVVATMARVVADPDLGGKRRIEQQNLVPAVAASATASTVTLLTDQFLEYSLDSTFGPNPPINKDMNPLGTR